MNPMAKSIKLPTCPYCHKRISYIGSMFLKTKGEYNCPQCKCISNVVIARSAYAIASAVCIVALLIVVFYTVAGDHSSFLGIACVLAPFLIFYLVVPLFVRLVPCKDQSAVKKILDRTASDMPGEAAYQAAMQSSTRPVMLDVEEDFSAKFMKAKSHTKPLQETDEDGLPAADGEPKDIQNTRIAFEINHETLMMAESRSLSDTPDTSPSESAPDTVSSEQETEASPSLTTEDDLAAFAEDPLPYDRSYQEE